MASVLTFLFTDLVGSTELLGRLGEARAEIVRRAYFGLLREATGANGGREVKSLGDGVMIAFESPSAAVACAVAMQRAFARHNARGAERLDVRIGLQVGEAIEGDEPYEHDDYFGGPVVEARRLCDSALGGQILVSALVRALAAPHSPYEFVPLGLLQLRGVEEPVSAFEVVVERAERERVPLPPELTASGSGSAFVGRAGPREDLLRAWHLAEAGERQLALVTGEPGIGKTRLAAEFAVDAYGAGAVVLWGRCLEDALVPYQPFVQALRHYVATCDPEELSARVVARAGPLVRLLPELAERAPDAAPAVDVEPQTERYQLFDAISGLLVQIAAEAPLLLVLDDLQWADEATLLLLRSLATDPRPASVLVLGTYRDSEVRRSHPLALIQADILRERAVTSVQLDGLSGREVSTLVDSLLGWELPGDVARTLHDETEGNPFFLEEVVRHLEELGVVSEHVRDFGMTVDELGVPHRVRELVARRVQRLSRAAIETLSVASVIGAEFGLGLLAAVLAADEERVVALLDEGVDARLLAELPGRLGEYGFTHALVRQVLYEEQTANRRAMLHARIAETVEAVEPSAAAVLALHFSLAGARYLPRVVEYGRAAGRQALDLLAYEDAAREFQRALGALALGGVADPGEYAELLVLLGAAHMRSGDATSAEAAFEEAAELAMRVGAATTLARAALGYGGGTGFGGVWTKFARVDATLVRFLEQSLVTVGDGDPRLRVQLLGRLADALYWGTDTERAPALSDQALELARGLGDATALAHALDSRHVALWQPDNLEELRTVAKEMLLLGQEAQDREIQVQAYAWLITDALEVAPIEVVDGYIDEHERLAHELRQPYHLWYTEVAHAMRAHLDGRYAEMRELVERAWEHGRTAHTETAAAVRVVQSFHLELDSGSVDDVLDVLESTAAASPLPAVQAVLALAYATQGRREDARQKIGLFEPEEFGAVRRDCVWSSTVCYLAEAVATLDAIDEARALYRQMLPYGDRNCVAGGAILCLGPMSRFLGMLARVAGDHEQALLHLRHALARSRTLGAAPLVARTQLETARVLADRGEDRDVAQARALLDDALAAAQELGMQTLERDVRELDSAVRAARVLV